MFSSVIKQETRNIKFDTRITVHDKNLSEISFSVFFVHIMRYGSDSNGDIDSMRGQLHDV